MREYDPYRDPNWGVDVSIYTRVVRKKRDERGWPAKLAERYADRVAREVGAVMDMMPGDGSQRRGGNNGPTLRNATGTGEDNSRK